MKSSNREISKKRTKEAFLMHLSRLTFIYEIKDSMISISVSSKLSHYCGFANFLFKLSKQANYYYFFKFDGPLFYIKIEFLNGYKIAIFFFLKILIYTSFVDEHEN